MSDKQPVTTGQALGHLPIAQFEAQLQTWINNAVQTSMQALLKDSLGQMHRQLKDDLTAAINVAVAGALKDHLGDCEKDRKSLKWRMRNLEADQV
jgi:hypothetical protein